MASMPLPSSGSPTAILGIDEKDIFMTLKHPIKVCRVLLDANYQQTAAEGQNCHHHNCSQMLL
jgi:hypothetical protein